jgi:hypothetical protein
MSGPGVTSRKKRAMRKVSNVSALGIKVSTTSTGRPWHSHNSLA